MRQKLRIAPIPEPDIHFKVAMERSELETAYALLHDCYVRAGLTDPHPSGLRCTVFTALPYTTTIVTMQGDRVIGTVSLIRDSSLGFPSDCVYRAENDRYREKGRRMLEVSALAVHPDFRRDHRISLHLMKYLYTYAANFMSCDMLCATVHPRALDFYAGLLGFVQNGQAVRYGFVKGAPAVHITLDLDAAYRDLMPRMYRKAPRERDLYSFMLGHDPRHLYPERNPSSALDPVMTPELLRYFFIERTPLFLKLPRAQRALIRSAYALNFDMNAIPELSDVLVARQFRYPVDMEVTLRGAGHAISGKIRDLSTGGLKIETSEPLQLETCYEAVFDLGELHFRIPTRLTYQRSSDGGGERWAWGGQFLVTDLRLFEELRAFHHRADAPDAVDAVARTKTGA